MSESTFTFVEPSVTPIEEHDLTKKVERCYRICYKSEHHIKQGSENFLKSLIHHTEGNHHWSPLEHARIVMNVGIVSAGVLAQWEEDRHTRYLDIDPRPALWKFKDGRVINITDSRLVGEHVECKVEGNFRTFIEFITDSSKNEGRSLATRYVLANELSKHFPIIFPPELAVELKRQTDLHPEYIKFKFFDSTCKYLGESGEYRTYHVVTSRDILQELARHRSLSFSVESTRYCNYAKKGIVFCMPRPYEWADDLTASGMSHPEALALTKICKTTSETYLGLIEQGIKPQVARMVLPGALKTEMMLTGTIKQWEAFLKLRDDDAAHPMIRVLAKLIKADLDEYKHSHTVALHHEGEQA